MPYEQSFDLDGTLIDQFEAIHRAFSVPDSHGLPKAEL